MNDLAAGFFQTNIFTSIFGLLLGIGFLWVSSEVVIRKITPIAKHFRVKELVITILGVSVLSSLPELTISAFAALEGKSDISIGNVIGSNFVTLTFVTAFCALISPIKIMTEIKERESVWMTLSTTVILILAVDGTLSRIDGVILILLYTPYIYSVIKAALKESREALKPDNESNFNLVLGVVIGVLAIFGIIVGANISLISGEKLGELAGIPPLALGVLIFALGTSLPELAIAVSATLKNKSEVSIGEIYSSNIFTAFVVLGICALISPLTVSKEIISFDLPFLILSGIIIQIFVTTGSKLVRTEAVMILLLYIYFVLKHFIKLPFLF